MRLLSRWNSPHLRSLIRVPRTMDWFPKPNLGINWCIHRSMRLIVSNSRAERSNKLSSNPDSVNPFGPVNRERLRDSAILAGVGTRKRAILDVDLAGRDEQLGPAVNKKPHKTRDLNEKSRDSRLGFLCLPDWLSFEPILKGSPYRTLSAKSL
jgi:hypothetical protein